MWVALFDFCLFVLLLSFLLYGLREWKNLLSNPDEAEDGAFDSSTNQPDNSAQRLSIWVLLGGLGLVSILSGILEWFAVHP